MRIFLSYASEDRDRAEAIAESIRARGHKVFFDRTDLPAGETYEDQIEAAIERAALMVFLVSPHSVSAGRFTLTELSFAQRKWPSAKNRVLPVTIATTPIDTVPAYLRAVTILEPKGNMPAEVAAAVDRLGMRMPRLIRKAALALVVVAAAMLAFWYLQPPKAEIAVRAGEPSAYQRGFFGEPDLYNIIVEAPNTGAAAARVVDLSFEVEPDGAMTRHDLEPDDVVNSEIVAPGASFVGHILVESPSAATEARWRACLHFEELAEQCSPFEAWSTTGEMLYGDSFDIDGALAKDARAIAWDGAAYLVGAVDPNRLLRLNEQGAVLAQRPLDGTPTAISAGDLGVYIGLAAPNTVLRVDRDTLATTTTIDVTFPASLRGAFDNPVSSRPDHLAQDDAHVWMITRGGAAANGLGYFDANLTALTTPSYFDEVSFDLPGMTLRPGGGAVWSGDNNTSPASIRRLSADELTVFGGHEFDIASCASDVVMSDGVLYAPDCSGVVHAVTVDGERLDLGRRLDAILGYGGGPEEWDVVHLGQTPELKLVGAVSVRTTPPSTRPPLYRVVLNALDWTEGGKLRFEATDARLLEMAVGSQGALMLIENAAGARQMVAPWLVEPN